MTEDVKIHHGTLFDYTAGAYCGVLMKENVMRKLAALQQRHLEEVKHVLSDGADRGEVFASLWTLHYPDGVQTEVRYVDTSTNVYDAIKRGTIAAKPRPIPLCFIAGSMQEAAKMADARHYSTTKET